jgi:hypothetical protein
MTDQPFSKTPPKNVAKNPRYAGVDVLVWRRYGRRIALLRSTDMSVRMQEHARMCADGRRVANAEARAELRKMDSRMREGLRKMGPEARAELRTLGLI